MAYLKLENIFKSYYLGKTVFPVLKGINLEFNLGEFVSILGESGGGKSTLMNIIGGLDRQFKGKVIVDNKLLDHRQESNLDAYRRHTVGYIYQSYNLISHLTVIENVKLSLEMTTLSAQKKEERAWALLKRVGLQEHAQKYPNQISGGQKQRVAIARALASDPKIIIADEPTGALDSQNTEEVLKTLDSIAAEGRLVIAVTHSQHVADASTRIVRLEDGKIVSDHSLRDSYQIDQQKPYLQSKKLSFLSSIATAYKHFKFQKTKNALIITGTAIGLCAVMLFNGLGTGVKKYVNKQITEMVNPTAVVVTRHAGSSGGTNNAQQSLVASSSQKGFTKNEIDRLKNIKDVTKVEKYLTVGNVTVSYHGKKATASTLNNWTSASSKGSVKNGQAPNSGEVVLDRKTIANKLKNHGKDLIGKTVTLTYQGVNKANKPVTVKFSARVSGLTNNSRSASNEVATSTLIKAMNSKNISPSATTLSVKVNKMANVKTATQKINKLKMNGHRVYSATSVSSLIKTVQTYINLITNILAAIASISLIVSALMIIVTMYMSVAERTKEIGILRALGESKGDIRRLFISESLIIGVFSSIAATVITFVFSLGGNALLSKITRFSFIQIDFKNVLSVFLISVVISLIASWLPARHAASLNPIDALAAD
ncbi:ABC transporter ATP-binding protein/permease [Liquorilactobacillus sicerae]|uniref:ABC transporter ATP-binding protein/permease n=1 Tax=Liquorilactobacillus sicerae TaxID=1416943 RepID=UPI00247FC61F|nr:ABC transporter ATP-binding protein/permease [Liquorilactobacillus sicerae]